MTVLGPTPPYIPIGISDYAELRERGFTYVDKTSFVAEVLASGAKAMLVPRPRRFGKTLNMSTLRYFVERNPEHDRTAIFDDTYVWTADGGRYREHFQRYPVIALSLKDLSPGSWNDCFHGIRNRVREELIRVWTMHGLGQHFAGDPDTLASYAELCGRSASPSTIAESLRLCLRWLHAATGERAVVIVDEYDAPLIAAHQRGYFHEAIDFFRPFYSGGLKDGPYLHKAVLTGILRIAKESIFSGLNNFEVHSILGDRMADAFGFTETEVAELLDRSARSGSMHAVRAWYNGYRFGDERPETIYNPWSILNYAASGASSPRPFWKNTSANELVREQLLRRAAEVGPDVERLIAGEAIRKTIDDNVVLRDLDRRADVVWSLLTFSGYLTPDRFSVDEDGYHAELRIPNREVASVFRSTFRDWLANAAGEFGLPNLVAALLGGDAVVLEDVLGGVLEQSASYHDFAHGDVEAVYHAFMLGLLVHLEPTHRVRSNREAGYGRADLLISPRTAGAGAVLELKTVRHRVGETVEAAIASALQQLRDRDYAAEVRADGATAVHQYGVVFDGKRCWVRVV